MTTTPRCWPTRPPASRPADRADGRGLRAGAAPPTRGRRWPSPRRSRPSTCSSSAPAPRRWPTRVRRRLLFVGRASGTAFGDYVAGSNHVLPTGGAARFASGLVDAPLPPAHERGPDRRGRRRARAGRRADRRAEGFTRHAASMEACARMPRHDAHRRDRPQDQGDRHPSRRSTSTAPAPAPARRASASSTTCSTCWPATAASTSTSHVTGDLQTGAHHTVEDTGHRPRPGARPGAGRPRRDHAATATPSCRWTRRARACALDISGPPVPAPSRPTSRPAAPATSTTSWPRSSSGRSPAARG